MPLTDTPADRVNPQTLRTLTILSTMLIVVGAMIPAPMARLSLTAMAGFLAIAPICWGGMRWRIVGVLLAIVSLALSVEAYPEAVIENERHAGRVHDR